MDFKTYWRSLSAEAKRALAAGCDTSVGYLSLVAGGFKTCGETLALKVERESAGQVTVEELRPDVPWDVVRGKPIETPCATEPAPDLSAPSAQRAA